MSNRSQAGRWTGGSYGTLTTTPFWHATAVRHVLYTSHGRHGIIGAAWVEHVQQRIDSHSVIGQLHTNVGLFVSLLQVI